MFCRGGVVHECLWCENGEKPAMLVVDILDLVMKFKSKFVMLMVCSIFGMSGETPMLAIDILNLLVKVKEQPSLLGLWSMSSFAMGSDTPNVCS